MFLLREALPSDLADLGRLARQFDTVNLPDDPKALRQIVALSNASFRGTLSDPWGAQYVFVAEDLDTRRVVGTSMIIAQHGRLGEPHIYFEVLTDERYSDSLGSLFRHDVLRLGFSYDGPTEIGGIVALPSYRGRPEKLGKQLSFVRFVFIAMHRARFRDRLLAELLPPFGEDGHSPLWEALGRRFTGLSYQEADRASKANKEFIRALFPTSPIYATTLTPEAREALGAVGPDTQGVQRMLVSVGFRYAQRLDPFDGGPHYEADTDEVSAVRDARRARVAAGTLHAEASGEGLDVALVAVATTRGRARFRCVQTPLVSEPGGLRLPAAARAALRVKAGDAVWWLSVSALARA